MTYVHELYMTDATDGTWSGDAGEKCTRHFSCSSQTVIIGLVDKVATDYTE